MTPEELKDMALAASTLDQYRRTLERLRAEGFAWPPTTKEVCARIAERVTAGRSLSTVKAEVSAIRAGLRGRVPDWDPGPELGGEVSEVLRGAKRATPEPASARPIRPEQLRAAVDSTELVRDRAVLVIGWLGGLRRAEIVGLNCEDGEVFPQGLELRLRSPKGRAGESAYVRLPRGVDPRYCPVLLWQALVRGRTSGPAIVRRDPKGEPTEDRLGAQSVRAILKHALERAGLDARLYTAHGMRAGVASAASAGGVPLDWTGDHLRHRSLTTTQGYVRGAPWERNPTRGLLDDLDSEGKPRGLLV